MNPRPSGRGARQTETSVGPPARSPWDPRTPAGGCSGGAAAAVAAGLAPAAHGSDGAGSIRIPASVCGLYGIKPTRGRISFAPIIPDLAGLSTNGPIARTVADAAALLDVMAHNAPGDLYLAPPHEGTFLSCAFREPGRLRIARYAEPVVPEAEVDAEVLAAYEEAAKTLADLGHDVVEIPRPFGPDVVPTFVTLWYAFACMHPVPEENEHLLRPLTRWLRRAATPPRRPASSRPRRSSSSPRAPPWRSRTPTTPSSPRPSPSRPAPSAGSRTWTTRRRRSSG
ncbi:amidase family protein [Nonomuraea sp. NPDC049421]|uniref:amidase family protein n=1 Tax=Nonomuraea sp. NPDC049421 TaxID=3155275 RepID=UPI00343CBB1F